MPEFEEISHSLSNDPKHSYTPSKEAGHEGSSVIEKKSANSKGKSNMRSRWKRKEHAKPAAAQASNTPQIGEIKNEVSEKQSTSTPAMTQKKRTPQRRGAERTTNSRSRASSNNNRKPNNNRGNSKKKSKGIWESICCFFAGLFGEEKKKSKRPGQRNRRPGNRGGRSGGRGRSQNNNRRSTGGQARTQNRKKRES